MSARSKTFLKDWGHLLVDAVVVIFVFAASAYVREVVSKELKDYVPRHEDKAQWKAHREWSDEVLKGIHGQLGDLRTDSATTSAMAQENNAMLRELRAEMRAAKRVDFKNRDVIVKQTEIKE